MGQVTDAFCRQCGYRSEVVIGGTMESFAKHSVWPAFCKSCDEMVAINTRSDPIVCLKCNTRDVSRYGYPTLSDNSGPIVVTCESDTLRADGHFCPGCRQRTLAFGTGRGGSHILFD